MTLSSIATLQETGALADEANELAETDHRTGLCPEGHGILSRAKASWTRPFYVERCDACSGIWLDAGEWKRLSAEHLLGHLDDLWLPSWRKRMQQAHSAAQLHGMLRARLGDELLARVDALATELAAHEHGDMGLALLREAFAERRPRRRE